MYDQRSCNENKTYQHLNETELSVAGKNKLQEFGDTKSRMKIPRMLWIPLVGIPLLIVLTATALILSRRPLLESVPYESLLRKARVRANVYALVQATGAANAPDRFALADADDTDATDADADKVVSCYYNTPNQYESHQLMPSSIHPHLCTHINVAFASVVDKQISLHELQYRILEDIVKLKTVNPKLKILLSVGGAGNYNGFSEMVVDHASRKIFIKSIKSILRNYTLDGIDLDWEFPAVHSRKDRFSSRERQHFSQLLREIRAEYIREKRDYWLTVAVAAPETIVDISYDVDQMNMYVDFVNIMTYDFHSFTKFTPLTGLNSPLYARSTEYSFLATLNINYTVQMYMMKGLDPNKIVVGIPTYGHSYTLINANNSNIGSPASGYGSLGGLGFVDYPDICRYVKNHKCDTIIKEDYDAKVPYLYRQSEWVSFDTPQSVMEKAKYIKNNKLRGAMIYSLNSDDYEGTCDGDLGDSKKFPLSQSISNILQMNR